MPKAPVTLKNILNPVNTIRDDNSSLVKQHIEVDGGIWFLFHSDSSDYSDDGKSYYHPESTSKTTHAALIVGWDDNYSADKFKTNPGINGAWLVRDSYGTRKHGSGYFWMSYKQQSVLPGLVNVAVFLVSQDTPDEENKVVEQNNDNPANKVIEPKWSAGIFRASRDVSLVQVAFNIPDNNAKYQVFVNNLGQERPTDPGDAENPAIDGSVPEAGDYTFTFPSPIEIYSGDYYSIIVKITPTSDYEYATAVEASIAGYVTASVKAGESFFATGEPVPDVWQDGLYIEGGPYNACIQAITIPRVPLETAPKIITSSLPDATAGQNYPSVTLQAAGTNVKWRWGNILQGMALNEQSGILSGRPVDAGEYSLNITAFNDAGKDTVTLRLIVARNGSDDRYFSRGGNCSSGFGCAGILLAAALFWGKRGR